MSEAAHDIIAANSGAMGVMEVLSKSLRAQFIAAPGHTLVGGDFSQIESRINAWLAGEQWKLDAFSALDRGEGPDTYKLAYSKAFGVPISDVTKMQRQIGKCTELSAGYQGSVGAFLRFVNDVNPIVVAVKEAAYGNEDWRLATEQHERLKFHNGLSAEQWISIKVVVNLWRAAHPKIVQAWWDRQDAAIEAVDNPGTKITGVTGRDGIFRLLCGGRISYLVTDGFLWCRLPSGKLLAYASPRLVEKKDDWLVDADGHAVPADEMSADEIAMRVASGCVLQEGRSRISVCYDGKNQKTGRWGSSYLYGGVYNNNDCQGTARELLRFAMHNVEDAGFPIVMHTHDETVSEVRNPLPYDIITRYKRKMEILPVWLEGLPLRAEAWTDPRYVK